MVEWIKKGKYYLTPAKVKTIKIMCKKTDINPYKLENRPYFERIQERKVLTKLRLKLYEKYKGKCPVCMQSLYNGERIELHHIIPKKKRGLNNINNLQPLHRICHVKVTHTNKI